ncbi:hypothetical protein [Acinetobacter lwoffii]|uniref:hypothetical protein n=2 Tax=Moraxellaceae TaxID=468 RepID=UPI0014867A0F|nr:hypothetical protein [Acinetobacter lwoffii]
MEGMMDFLQSYNGSIQALAAVLNLIFVGALAFYSHKLQKKNYSIELYSRLQQEIKDCIGEINECIKYFTIQEHKTSLYLYELHNKKDDDPYHIDLAEHILRDLNKILISLKTLRFLTSELNSPLELKDFKDNLQISNLSKLNSFKHFLLANHPAIRYEDHVNGAESHWVDEEYSANKAFRETTEIIETLERILRSK